MAVTHDPVSPDEARHAPPRVRPESVKKTDVIARLVASSSLFTTIIAPAGYGKTTLIGRWSEDDQRAFAWVSLDERDDDALVFLRDIAAAIHRVEPIAMTVFDALVGPGDSMNSIWTRVARVGNAIAALKRPVVIALDDLHTLSNPSCLSVLAALFDYVPPGSQIAITSRQEPALPLARWRAGGMLLEITADDLRLDHAEADILLRGADVTLDPADVAVLTEQTEGWPAGLYLAALSIRSGAPDLAHIKGFSGDDRYVSEYFRLEVLSRLPEQEARFVTRTSVLDTMNGPLCDAVLETSGSWTMLTRLERSNQFVVALDNRGERYRYHHLFRQQLRIQLELDEPDVVAELNRRAMVWYQAHDQPEAAVRFGQAAGAKEAVAALVDKLALPLYYDGRMDTLDEMLGWFNDDDLARYPAIAVFAGWVRALTGRAVEAERYLAIADGAMSVIPLSDGSASIEPWFATLRSFMMPDGVGRARADADRALQLLPRGSGWRPSALINRGIAQALLGSGELARDDLMAAAHEARAHGGTDDLFVAQAELALLELKQGNWAHAAQLAEEARALVHRTGVEHYAVSAIVHVVVARIALQERKHLRARTAMTQAHRLRPMLDHGIPWLTVQVGIELARAHLALGEAEAARAVLADTAPVLRRRPDLGSLREEVREIGDRVSAMSGSGDGFAVNLTAAELRLLPYLATHLTFPEIAGRLFITSHTVRSEAKAIYRKLDASSRGEAIDRAVDVGLLEPMFPHRTNVAV